MNNQDTVMTRKEKRIQRVLDHRRTRGDEMMQRREVYLTMNDLFISTYSTGDPFTAVCDISINDALTNSEEYQRVSGIYFAYITAQAAITDPTAVQDLIDDIEIVPCPISGNSIKTSFSIDRPLTILNEDLMKCDNECYVSFPQTKVCGYSTIKIDHVDVELVHRIRDLPRELRYEIFSHIPCIDRVKLLMYYPHLDVHDFGTCYRRRRESIGFILQKTPDWIGRLSPLDSCQLESIDTLNGYDWRVKYRRWNQLEGIACICSTLLYKNNLIRNPQLLGALISMRECKSDPPLYDLVKITSIKRESKAL